MTDRANHGTLITNLETLMKARRLLPIIWTVISALLELADRLRSQGPTVSRCLRARRAADQKKRKRLSGQAS